MTLASALREYFQGNKHVKGSPIALMDLKPFLTDGNSEAYRAELRSYGIEVQDAS